MYEITITKKETVKQMVGGDWAIIDVVPVAEGCDAMKDVYGYTPQIEREVEVTREILRQEVAQLNLSKVLKAINKM